MEVPLGRSPCLSMGGQRGPLQKVLFHRLLLLSLTAAAVSPHCCCCPSTLLQKPGDAPTASYLGVSPPVRSGCWGGATNPWSHDRSWRLSAYSASSTNLQALRELDSEGESFLKAKDSSCGRLVLAGSTAVPVAAADPADCSDAGSDTTAVNECAPFTCHTAYFLG
jgi:hypothetical protein